MFEIDQYVIVELLNGATLEGFFVQVAAGLVFVEQHVQGNPQEGTKGGVFLQAIPLAQIVMITADVSTPEGEGEE